MPKRPATPKGDSVRRVVRTSVQTGAAGAVVALIAAFTPLNPTQTAALTSVLTLAFSYLQNLLESQGAIPPMLKGPPPPPVSTIDPVMQAELEALAGAVADLRADLRNRPIGLPKP